MQRLNEWREATFTTSSYWPVDAASLAALIDLGMSDAAVARYFAVTTAEVERLRLAYAIARRPARR